MGKLTKEQRKELVLEYRLDNSKANIKRLANKYNITERRLFQIVKEDKNKEIVQNITESKDYFTKRANEIIKLAMDRIEQEILNGDKVTLSQLSTTLGILYDKSRLENNLSTSNNEVKISIKIEK